MRAVGRGRGAERVATRLQATRARAELHGENPFEYLVGLLVHSDAAAADPAAWLPWTFRATLARASRHARCQQAGWTFHTIWQFSDSGILRGDQNRFNGAPDRLKAFTH